MSKKAGQPPRHTSAATNKAVLISATAIAAASLVTVAYTLAAPPKESATATSFVTASSPSGLVRLSAAGLDSLLNTRFAPVHTAVTDQGTSAAQQVSVLLGNGSGQLSNDGSVLTMNVPAIGEIDGSVASALGPINTQMGDLSGSNGEVANSVNSDVVGISPLLNLTGPHATVSANVPVDLDAALAPQLAGTTQEGVVSIDPNAGTVAIDLSNLLADNGAGSQTLSPAATAEIEADINAASANLGDNLVNAATSSVENTPVNVNANVSLMSTPTSSSSGSCSPSTNTSDQTSAAGGGLLSGLLGNTLNGILGSSLGSTVDGTVSGLLCSLPTNLLGGLLTSLGLDQTGNVGQIIEGTAPPATGSITVLGAPKPFNGIAFTGNVANTLVKNFGG
ncbi:MAG TPA: choice-of-anchor G family protein, partial [Galbitalea sp.]|nr:choice-of-anchor G family protein [Galbitalea sp.]